MDNQLLSNNKINKKTFDNPKLADKKFYTEITFKDNTKNILDDDGNLILNQNYEDFFFANQFLYIYNNKKFFIANNNLQIINPDKPIDEIIAVFPNTDNPIATIKIKDTYFIINHNFEILTSFKY